MEHSVNLELREKPLRRCRTTTDPLNKLRDERGETPNAEMEEDKPNLQATEVVHMLNENAPDPSLVEMEVAQEALGEQSSPTDLVALQNKTFRNGTNFLTGTRKRIQRDRSR